ncbi:hypothetical protein MTX78_16005 [Hymenobacter tibetensis]|uniref:Phosphatase PAP2 family protein n=1 Tax=Hymenobacter tibetensis TaxID=497967 RepID=A0ABY4CTP1_9BACT|nr:hypothetical protein [Hymenobacter tibetensis]UOG73624.1 hypothetical protein MTX78_16005 [Hymenobacter tibetensis]
MAWQKLDDDPTAKWSLGSVATMAALIGIWSFRQTYRGAYSNLDVSQQKERQSFYPVLLVVLGLATGVLFWQQAGLVRYGLLTAWLLLLTCYVINFWLKISLHAALSFFLACVVLYMYATWGVLALLLATVVAASRLVLQRHTVPELVAGALAGVAAGGGLVWFLAHATANGTGS